MSASATKEHRASRLLALLYVLGGGLLIVPFLLRPPAFLDLVPRDRVFASNLAGKTLRVTEVASGRTRSALIERQAGGGFIASFGKIESGLPSTLEVGVEGYQPATVTVTAPPLQRQLAEVDLVPTFGRLELTVVDARRDSPLAATVKGDGRVLSAAQQSLVTLDLPAGRHSFAAESAGYCGGESDFEIQPGKLVRGRLPLSQELEGEELARLVLGWHENPRDLDAHLVRWGAPPESPTHVYFAHKAGELEGAVYARLDVDYQNAEGYETITVLDRADGEFEYYVARYAGEGTLGGSRAWVDVLTAGCQRRHYTVPPACSEDIWAVARLQIRDRQIAWIDEQRCLRGQVMKAPAKQGVAANLKSASWLAPPARRRGRQP